MIGDAYLVIGCMLGAGVLYAAIAFWWSARTEATPRPDLEEGKEGDS